MATSSDDLKALTRLVFDKLINQGSMSAFDELVAADYVDHTGATDREDYRDLIRATRTAFPDLHLEIEDLIAEGDKVVARFTARATHRAEFQGIPATGKQVSWEGIGILRFRNGQMVERWNQSDIPGLMEQLGSA